MSGPTYLSDAQFAEIFAEQNSITPGMNPVDLEPIVKAWLDRAGMSHRNAFTIAIQAAKLAPEPAPAPVATPEQALWQQNQMEGVGNPQQPMSAEEIAALDMWSYSKLRSSLGTAEPSLLDFLGGQGR